MKFLWGVGPTPPRNFIKMKFSRVLVQVLQEWAIPGPGLGAGARTGGRGPAPGSSPPSPRPGPGPGPGPRPYPGSRGRTCPWESSEWAS